MTQLQSCICGHWSTLKHNFRGVIDLTFIVPKNLTKSTVLKSKALYLLTSWVHCHQPWWAISGFPCQHTFAHLTTWHSTEARIQPPCLHRPQHQPETEITPSCLWVSVLTSQQGGLRWKTVPVKDSPEDSELYHLSGIKWRQKQCDKGDLQEKVPKYSILISSILEKVPI